MSIKAALSATRQAEAQLRQVKAWAQNSKASVSEAKGICAGISIALGLLEQVEEELIEPDPDLDYDRYCEMRAEEARAGLQQREEELTEPDPAILLRQQGEALRRMGRRGR